MNNAAKAVRRPLPANIPGWVVWLLGLDQPDNSKSLVWIIIFGAAVTIAAALNTVPPEHPVAGELQLTVSGAWAITMAMVLIVLTVLGMQRLLRAGGILISERNLMSLTRFQITGWTVLIGSAILAVGLCRAFHPEINAADALDLFIPEQVWQLLGISSGSTVLAAMIKKNKQQKEPADPEGVTEHAASMIEGESAEEINQNREGVLYANKDPKDARFMDMFEGDELANTTYLDIAKVQMFFFTVIALLTYGGTLWTLLYTLDASTIAEFPGLTPTLVTITGVSHAAYIGAKAVTQTTTDPNATPTNPIATDSDHEDAGELDH
jgi:hypothetical protein